MFRKALFLSSALMSTPLITQAHDGHGFFHGNELAHYITSAEHAIPLALVVAAAVLLISYQKWSQARKNV
ncbi:MAG: hypothetical protein KDD06_16225 [Phaeodactylibacter sp.]|nr:hypothetical protein [Phaeodactylibacter sp.]MCB9264165.1 hypothetical protein [Lewinellaceae bacterium]MCB9286785.1 hypothetical protein [Lewinellaceae bacterium]